MLTRIAYNCNRLSIENTPWHRSWCLLISFHLKIGFWASARILKRDVVGDDDEGDTVNRLCHLFIIFIQNQNNGWSEHKIGLRFMPFCEPKNEQCHEVNVGAGCWCFFFFKIEISNRSRSTTVSITGFSSFLFFSFLSHSITIALVCTTVRTRYIEVGYCMKNFISFQRNDTWMCWHEKIGNGVERNRGTSLERGKDDIREWHSHSDDENVEEECNNTTTPPSELHKMITERNSTNGIEKWRAKKKQKKKNNQKKQQTSTSEMCAILADTFRCDFPHFSFIFAFSIFIFYIILKLQQPKRRERSMEPKVEDIRRFECYLRWCCALAKSI